jgi:acyl-CoA hydrolase
MLSEAILELVILHLVRPQDLNHHGTLFAGQMAKWILEAGVITASRLCGRPEDVVCVQLNGMTFKKPINDGDLIEIKTKIAYLGSTSITVCNQVFRKQDIAPVVTSMATFVTVDKENKPYKHGFKLSKEYISKNGDIYEEALKIRARK